MSLQNAYGDHVDFGISEIEWEDDYERQISSPSSSNEDKASRKQEIAERLDAARKREENDDEYGDEDRKNNPEYYISDRLKRALNEEAFRLDREIRSSEEEFESEEKEISFVYSAPSISVDASGRFATHEIIGGSTVRQKIGENPIEVSIDGVCVQSTAKRLDELRNAKYGTIYSNRLQGGSLTVQFASTSTQPLADSGAVSLTEAEFLYSYTLECVEVLA